MNVHDYAAFRQAQEAFVSRYNTEHPDAQQRKFAECMQAVQTELYSYVPLPVTVKIPCPPSVPFNPGEYNLKAPGKTLKLSFRSKYEAYSTDGDNCVVYGVFDLLASDVAFYTTMSPYFELLWKHDTDTNWTALFKTNVSQTNLDMEQRDDSGNTKTGTLTSLDVIVTKTDATSTFGISSFSDAMKDVPNELIVSVMYDGLQLVRGTEIVNKKSILAVHSFMQGFESLTRESISRAFINPGPPIRAHLFTKRRKINADDFSDRQAYLEHEVRDVDHSTKWWADKLCAVSYAYSQLDPETIQSLSGSESIDAVYASLSDRPTFTVDSTWGYVTIESSNNKIMGPCKHCNGFYTSSFAADGNILSAGVTNSCLLKNGIDVLYDNELASHIPFAGMDDPADKYALAIPAIVKVIARSADAIPVGTAGTFSSTLMQLGSTKTLSKYAKYLLSLLSAACAQSPRSTDPEMSVEQCKQMISAALVEMYKADKSGNPTALQNTIEEITSRPSFVQVLNNPESDQILKGANRKYKIKLKDSHVQVWKLTMLLGLNDQADLHSLSQIEAPIPLELHNANDRTWVQGNCVTDAYQMKEMHLYGIPREDNVTSDDVIAFLSPRSAARLTVVPPAGSPGAPSPIPFMMTP